MARRDDRIIIHLDYDCFYASVFEVETPALRSVPLAVQQKNIVVTCNYEARRRGLRKLQLLSDARRLCPDVVVVLGEELGRFRDVSKTLYTYLASFTWSNKAERLGLDEVFLDVSDIVAYNQPLLNTNDLGNAFFHLSREDPTRGFSFDAANIASHAHPDRPFVWQPFATTDDGHLATRLVLGSHLAQHIRRSLEEDKGYTSSVGISTSKLLAKLVGNRHKPRGQTTLTPPYRRVDGGASSESNVTAFMDAHNIGNIPGIGFKMSHKIRNHVLSHRCNSDDVRESVVTVGDVRRHPDMGPELLEKLLGGPRAERGIGAKAWRLINGIDNSEVGEAKMIPSQISIEDSYMRLDTVPQAHRELLNLATSLLKRMHVDLLSDANDKGANTRWIAYPRTIRLSTRPRLPPNADGSRTRTFNRISRSGPLPNFIFNLREGVDALVSRLVQETLVPMFHRLHPAKQNWNLSLINIAVTNVVEIGGEDGSGEGRDIGRMFKRQDDVLKEWRVEDKDVPPDSVNIGATMNHEQSHDSMQGVPSAGDEALEVFLCELEDGPEPAEGLGDEEEAIWDEHEDSDRCGMCGVVMPAFAKAAHERYHALDG